MTLDTQYALYVRIEDNWIQLFLHLGFSQKSWISGNKVDLMRINEGLCPSGSYGNFFSHWILATLHLASDINDVQSINLTICIDHEVALSSLFKDMNLGKGQYFSLCISPIDLETDFAQSASEVVSSADALTA